ncbi:AT-rich interactive domain-containing protein 4A isoform X2 [Sphaeramia orbicularis]|uniref:AT-rich interactive domain-containing protein 4A isoform X2 n=1 Tax=Sphaeramia orbicularis TaxID=375764 RepID=UPI0011811CC3|nr:AT-rich interactive domain-containing protein 4A isoform X2 [Sphaeramia orbicularis]
MKAADEPAYLTVGTDVSAKYRGAFCEAKIKTVKRMVKVKVTLKGESTSQVVQDDQVKGHLRVGSTVEVRTGEGVSSEAVISKLTDASLYTVVFDDGDEKTLRRTSLCLKGERHFAESETLDQLPLTNPEHFGTPVIGKKSNRGGRRSSQAVADEENESSSSEDEEEDRRRLNDELLGKVCSIENQEQSSSSSYMALVVSPSCNDELAVKKDQCLVRSFGDGKFYTVARRHVHAVNYVSISKSEFSNRKGFEGAQVFLRTRDVPDLWKMDMSQILDSSSSDEEDDEDDKDSEEEEDEEEEEEEEEDDTRKKKKHIKEEPEEELDPAERDLFLQQLYKFMEDRGTPINKPPVLGYKDLNLFKLFRLVYHQGGCHKIESGTVWKQIYMDLGIPVLNSAASYNVKTAYRKYLYGFEEYCRSASITFRTIHHNNPRPPANHTTLGIDDKEAATPIVKVEPSDVKREEAESESESEKEEVKERQSSPRGRRRGGVGPLKMDRESLSRADKRGDRGGDIEEPRDIRRRSNRRMDDSERGSEEDEDDDEDEEEDEGDRRRGDRSEEDGEEEEDGDSVTGTKVRVKYGRGKTQKIYEAHIKKTDVDNGEQFYLVHYYGWNVRYDEWVKADRIIWPVDKGSKKRTRKKLSKDKDDLEKDEDKAGLGSALAPLKPPGARRGRPQIRTPPTGSNARNVSKTPSTEGRSNGKMGRSEMMSNMANGDNTPRRRTRRTSGMYDSDRASNEDSGNSSEDSESEDPPDRKQAPWRGRAEAPPPEEKEGEEEQEEELKEEEKPKDTPPPVNAISMVTTGQPPAATAPSCPSMPQEKADRVLSQSENTEAEQGEEPAGEAVVPVQEVNQTPPPAPPPPSSPPPSTVSEDSAPSTPLSSSRIKGRRSNLREAGSETPPRMPSSLCSASSPANTPPRGVLKRQDEPMVVLHCLPTPRLLPPTPNPASDTDSASEDEEGAESDGSMPLKRKATEVELRDEKKLRPDDPQSPKATPTPSPKTTPTLSPKAIPTQPRREESERSDIAVKMEEEHLVSSEAPPPAPHGPAPSDDLVPPIGPEALVCHEVDLDDLDDREKPAPVPAPSQSEALLLMMREQQQAPPPPPHMLLPPQPPVRPFLQNSAPTCPEELHPPRGSTQEEEQRGATGGEQEGDSSPASSSTSASHLSHDRGQKRLMECNQSPSAKKPKRSQKRPSTPAKAEKNGGGHSSDSEDQSRLTSLKSQKSRCSGLTSPPTNKDKQSCPSPQRTYKWTFQLDELDNMSSAERISFLQDKLQQIRKYYLSLKSEVASIDRRRKRLKKKEREVSHAASTSSSGSSDTGMSPSSASPTQNTVAVECR